MDPDSALQHEEKKDPTFGEILKWLFFKKFGMNLFGLLVLLSAFVFGAIYIANLNDPVFEPCPNVNSTECEICEEFEEIECPSVKCPACNITEEIVAYYYRCEDGRIVNESIQCDDVLLEITSTYMSAENGITISIDDVDYTYFDGEGRIDKIDYTIINQGDHAIKPKVGVKVYDEWTQSVKDALPVRTFTTDDILVKNDGIRKSESVLIDFSGDEQTIRLELVDSIPDPDYTIATVLWEFIE